VRLATLLLLPLAGCGYTAGLDLSREGIRTVAVEVTANETFRQRIEIPLTTELYAALPIHTQLTPTSADVADAILTVEIGEVSGRSLIRGGIDPVREGALIYSVRAVLRNRRTGAILRDRRLHDRAEFRAPIGETEQSAVREASADLARKIALALEPDF